MRQTLREAKNVVKNIELLTIEYYALEDGILDFRRPSGMTKRAEQEVKSHAGTEGQIYLISWNKKKNRVADMDYLNGDFFVHYQYNESDDSYSWNIYSKVKEYDNKE